MIQDLGTHCYHNEYTPVPPRDTDCILFYEGHSALVKTEGDVFSFPSYGEAKNACPQLQENYVYLFSIDDTRYYLSPDLTWEALSGYGLEDISLFRTHTPKKNCFALITGYQLFNWYASRKFCGKCGHALKPSPIERMLECPCCHNTEYPKISPAVIVAVRNQDKLLMTKYAGRASARYALIAGFAEIGETAEDTVRREVMEEVGLKVKNITYYKSQPWSLTSTLLFGYVCDLDGDDKITLEEQELSEAAWFSREEIPYDDYDVSLTREMMINFKKGLL